jgi:hypothetical protein
MACERFADALKARALGDELPAGAAAHLAVCSSCQAALEREERLQSTIASALADVGAAAPAPDFAARVRTGLLRTPGRRYLKWWMPAAAAVAALVIAAYAIRVSSPRSVDSGKEGWVALPAPAKAPVVDVPRAQRTTAVARAKAAPGLAAGALGGVEVLVPRQEREAVDRLFASLRAGRPEVVSVLGHLEAGGVTNDARAVTVAPIRIDPVSIPALPPSASIFDR